jgi:predicted nucleotidyltransferase
MQCELSTMLGREVDLHRRRLLNPPVGEQALAEAEVQHVAP